jgi:hypothetical protein
MTNFFRLLAQPGLTAFTDFGESNVSRGLYVRSAINGHYTFGKNSVETGALFYLKNNIINGLSAYDLNVSRNLVIKGRTFQVNGFCLLTNFSEILRETNFGSTLKMRHNHFEIAIGTNFRTYAFSNKAIKEYGIDKNASKIHEKFNFMYSFAYYLKPTDNKWNVGLSMTNIDYFIINQETNPTFNLLGSYKLYKPVSAFMQVCYKRAGAMNLAVNYFGYFIRTGITWAFN